MQRHREGFTRRPQPIEGHDAPRRPRQALDRNDALTIAPYPSTVGTLDTVDQLVAVDGDDHGMQCYTKYHRQREERPTQSTKSHVFAARSEDCRFTVDSIVYGILPCMQEIGRTAHQDAPRLVDRRVRYNGN